MSCARSRNSITVTSASTRALTAAVSRSASRRVDDGWLSPADTTTKCRRFLSVSTASPVISGLHLLAARFLLHLVDERRMRRGVGHLGRPTGVELAPQHGHDLSAEDVQLLEHRLERQAGVIHEEQLALVVAEQLTHARVPIDDLLRRPDREGRLG